jgi:hypothetical protein
MFTEEQFEVYRALGFHAAHRFFDRRDGFAHLDPQKYSCVGDHIALLDEMFPLASPPEPGWPREHTTFTDWVNAEAAAAVKQAAEQSATAAANATMAQAATKIAAASEVAAVTVKKIQPVPKKT